jgi:hypothetical protein
MDGRKVRKTKGDGKRSAVFVHIFVKGVDLAYLAGNCVRYLLRFLWSSSGHGRLIQGIFKRIKKTIVLYIKMSYFG